MDTTITATRIGAKDGMGRSFGAIALHTIMVRPMPMRRPSDSTSAAAITVITATTTVTMATIMVITATITVITATIDA